MPTSPVRITSHNFAAANCRAQDPATCRVHGIAAGADGYLHGREQTELSEAAIRQQLAQGLVGTLSALETAVAASAPAYLASGALTRRLQQFDVRLGQAAADLPTAIQRAHLAGEPVDADLIRSQLSHNLYPVIGWLHSDLGLTVPEYDTHPLCARVDAIRVRLLELCESTAKRYA